MAFFLSFHFRHLAAPTCLGVDTHYLFCPFDRYLEVEWPGHILNVYLTSNGAARLCSKVAVVFYIVTNNECLRGFAFIHPYQYLVLPVLLITPLLTGVWLNGTVVLICISYTLLRALCFATY